MYPIHHLLRPVLRYGLDAVVTHADPRDFDDAIENDVERRDEVHALELRRLLCEKVHHCPQEAGILGQHDAVSRGSWRPVLRRIDNVPKRAFADHGCSPDDAALLGTVHSPRYAALLP